MLSSHISCNVYANKPVPRNLQSKNKILKGINKADK